MPMTNVHTSLLVCPYANLQCGVTCGCALAGVCEGGEDGESEAGPKRRRGTGQDQPADPSATLEPNVESLNVKKFDLTFAVDPLFHKTSAQFDEGGAKGALNPQVYLDCIRSVCIKSVPIAAVHASSAGGHLAAVIFSIHGEALCTLLSSF